MIEFIKMKIEIAEDVLQECYDKLDFCENDYEAGVLDGYAEAVELEIQTLNQILNKLSEL